MSIDADALVVGGGPAGASVAIWLAAGGWRVVLVERHAYPRQKVCGECISAGSLALLDALGVGIAVRDIAGPELRQIGWFTSRSAVIAQFPACTSGADRYGRAVGRDRLDDLLVVRARRLGVEVLQPAAVSSIGGDPGCFECRIATLGRQRLSGPDVIRTDVIRRVRVVIDAHGSWENPPGRSDADESVQIERPATLGRDLFGFKASFRHAALTPGVLGIVAVAGAYGGIVIADGGRTTLACCIRRDRLSMCRAKFPGASAGAAVEEYLRQSCPALRNVLEAARSEGHWLAVGPIRPGVRVDADRDIFRVGNSAGEAHPLIGEGISIALQSSGLLAEHLLSEPIARLDKHRTRELNCRYGAAWRDAFAGQFRLAAVYAHAAVQPAYAMHAHFLMRRWPSILTVAARWAGKSRSPTVRVTSKERKS